MQCILYKIYFWKVFHMYYKLICILYALLCGQIFFILVKSGCYIHDAKIRYLEVYKLLYAILIASRKLRHYFQAHRISVVT
jgi:hypothetical protein